MYLNKYII